MLCDVTISLSLKGIAITISVSRFVSGSRSVGMARQHAMKFTWKS